MMESSASHNVATWGLLPLRFVVALVFLMHGAQKMFDFGVPGVQDMLTKLGFPVPGLFAIVLIAIELLGGVAILLGFFSRIAGAILAAEMAIAIVVARSSGGFFTPYGFEFELTLMGACLTFAAIGAGGVSLDSIMQRRREPLVGTAEKAEHAHL